MPHCFGGKRVPHWFEGKRVPHRVEGKSVVSDVVGHASLQRERAEMNPIFVIFRNRQRHPDRKGGPRKGRGRIRP